MANRNPHTGSSFDDFLKEENLFEEAHAKALKRALAEQIGDGMEAAHLTKMAMPRKWPPAVRNWIACSTRTTFRFSLTR